MRAEPLHPPQAYHAEGPCWCPAWGGLRYVDMLAGDVLLLGDDDRVASRVHVGPIAAALRPRRGGGAIVAGERGFLLGRADDLSDLQPEPELWSDDGIRFNDGGCDPAGSFWCGTMAYAQTPGAASLWLRSADGPPALDVLDGLTISNGIGWSPDGGTAYLNDTPTRTISAFDWDAERGLSHRRPLVTLGDTVAGNPDGLTVDAEGGVWTALYGGSAVHRYAPDGTLSEVVELEPTQVTACTFGGPDLDVLYVTTSRENLPDDEQPSAGAVFAVRPGVRGLPAPAFAG